MNDDLTEVHENWLGQTIQVGSIVGRGARAGNTSDFRVGRVISFNAEKRLARVEWLLEPAYRHHPVPWMKLEFKSSVDINSLFVLDRRSFGFDFYKETR
jgi:hypothetical protein